MTNPRRCAASALVRQALVALVLSATAMVGSAFVAAPAEAKGGCAVLPALVHSDMVLGIFAFPKIGSSEDGKTLIVNPSTGEGFVCEKFTARQVLPHVSVPWADPPSVLPEWLPERPLDRCRSEGYDHLDRLECEAQTKTVPAYNILRKAGITPVYKPGAGGGWIVTYVEVTRHQGGVTASGPSISPEDANLRIIAAGKELLRK
jgi:hypothetical protein